MPDEPTSSHVGSPSPLLVVMGPSGAGKTTLGSALAAALGASFVDADDHHSPANLAKMGAGQSLDETDRAPWLERLRALLDAASAPLVLACSALRREHRRTLGLGLPERRLIYLAVEPDTLEARLRSRVGHFAGVHLLAGQLSALEPPEPEEGALVLDGSAPLDENVARVRDWLSAQPE